MTKETTNNSGYKPAFNSNLSRNEESFVSEIFERNGAVFDNTYELESVSGGLIHHVYKLLSPEKTMYLKIRGSSFSKLPGIQINPSDIQYEKKAMDILNQRLPEMFPHVLAYYANDHALLMTDVIPNGFTLEKLFDNDAVSDKITRECGKAIARFHKAVASFPPLRPDNDDISYSDNLFYRLGYLHIPELDETVKKLKQIPRQLIFGDFSPKNIGIDMNKKVTFCDLELVHSGNVIFDVGFLASHILLHTKSVDQGTRLLEAFLEGYLNEANTYYDKGLLQNLILGIGLFRLDNKVIPYSLPINEMEKKERILKIREILLGDIKPWSHIIERMTHA